MCLMRADPADFSHSTYDLAGHWQSASITEPHFCFLPMLPTARDLGSANFLRITLTASSRPMVYFPLRQNCADPHRAPS